MKILHINTSLFGGAARAALRLHFGLLQNNVNSKFLSLSKNSECLSEVFKYPPYNRATYKKVLSRFGLFKNSYQRNKKISIKGDFECFTFPKTDYDILDHPLVKDADIINLHWIANFLNYPSFFLKINKPIVWTLHDMNPFMGGFHYEGDLNCNHSGFSLIEEQLRTQKRDLIHQKSNMHIITPSNWLGKCSKKSKTFNRYQHFVIPYGLDTQIYKQRNKAFCSELLGVDCNKKVILFSSGNLNNKRKGFNVLLKALERLDSNKYRCIALGNKTEKVKRSFPVQYLGHVNEERYLSCIYSAADVFVIPTLEDNLPNTVLESLACGTPVIGSDVGGVPDMVRPGITGMLFEPGNSEELAQKIEEFFALSEEKRKEMSDNCRRIAIEEYDLSVQAKAYIELYEKILNI